MKVAFFVVMLFIALLAAIDITTSNQDSRKPSTGTLADSLGFRATSRRPDSVILFAITTAALVMALVLEVFV